MEYDLSKSFVFYERRQGKSFPISPSLAAFINERIDRERTQQVGHTEARDGRETDGVKPSAQASDALGQF